MNVQKNGASGKRVAGRGRRRPIVHWRCVVPGCTSNSNMKRHSFPKNVIRSEQWLQAINNPNLDGLTSDELRNYRICQLHFPESAYKITPIRQVLQDNAVPQLMLNFGSSAASPASTGDGRIIWNIEVAEDEKMQENCTLKNPLNDFMDFKVLPSWDDIYMQETYSPSKALVNNSKNLSILKKNTIENTTQHCDAHISSKSSSSVQNVEPSSSKDDSASKEAIAVSTPKTSKRQTLLGSVTRKNKLTPVAKCLHGIASDLLKKHSKYVHKLGTLKERSQSTEKYMAMVDMKKLKNLSKAQLRFLKMLTRNINRNINRLLKDKDSGARVQTHLAKQARIQYTKKCRKK